MAQIGFGNRVRIHGNSENPSNACGAVLEVKAGLKTEMMFHLKNDKILYMLMGKAKLIVIQDGVLKGRDFNQGESLSIPPGLAHQVEAIENSVIVEFGSCPEAYSEPQSDIRVIEKGTRADTEEQASSVIMTEEDRAKVEEAIDEAEKELTQPVKKKRRRRKKRDDN